MLKDNFAVLHRCAEEGVFPSDFKKSLVIPEYKLEMRLTLVTTG